MQDKYRITHRQAQETGVDDVNRVVTAFTEGLRDLPTDYATRVKNFLAEYLGTARHPVPFGGRGRDFEHLDAWLVDPLTAPYLLLAAPAGRGKSALLLRWCQRLLARPDVAVVYFPVSIRFRTNLAAVVFPSLVACLANLHGEKLPADPNTQEEVWRGLFVDYMTRPLPAGRSLVLVLDGIDEAADWTAGPGLFPQDPPSGLRVVLSARYLANDQDASAWLARLGWTREGLATTHQLYPLDRAGIGSVLLQMGFPLDLLSSRVDIVSELHRLSEGDPLLVRLYVDDLWERGEEAVRLRPEDLRAIRPGLIGYFERWWNDQRLLWREQATQREAAVQIVLSLLAAALGPLSRDDILALAPEEEGFRMDGLAEHMVSLSRFVIGDGIRQGYVFSHPRLASYFLEERLNTEERQVVERRFLAWGEWTLRALNEERLAPENASPYIVQYYGAHLERTGAQTPALLALVSAGWLRAWEKLDRAYAGFLGDIERAWAAAQREDMAATRTGQLAPYLSEELRCLLCRVSINSMTSNISPRLMLEAVKTGIWTPAQGLASIRLIADLAPRARELVGLAPYVQEPLRGDILQEALDTVLAIKDEYTRLDALVAIAPGLSAELLWQVLDVIPEIDDEADRAGVLAEVAPALVRDNALIAGALDLVQAIEEEEYRALALEGLASSVSHEQQSRVLQFARELQDERYRAQVLAALLPHATESVLQEIAQEARAIEDGLSRVRLLASLAASLPEQSRTEVVQEALDLVRTVEDREYRVEVIVALAPFLGEERLHQALQEVQLFWDESVRTHALIMLTSYMPEEQLPSLLQAVLAMKSEEGRTLVFLALLPRLPEALLEQALTSIQEIWDEGLRVEALAKLAPYVSEAQLPRMLETVRTVRDHGYRVWLLAELEAPLAGKMREPYLDMTRAFETIEGREERVQTLLAVAPRLSEEALAKLFQIMLPEIFGFSWRVQSEEQRSHVLAKLGPRLPEDVLPVALERVRMLSDEAYQVRVLVALAPRIRGALLSDVLDIVRAQRDREKRAQVLEALVSTLPAERKGARVQEMLQVLQVLKDEALRAHLVVAYAPSLPRTLPSASIGVIVEAVRALRDPTNQARVLEALATHLPEDAFKSVLRIVQAMRDEEALVQALQALVPHVPARLILPFFHAVLAIGRERWRAQVLATLLAHAPEKICVEVLALAQNTQDERASLDILTALARHAPEHLLSQVWDAIQASEDQRRHVWLLSTLILRDPERFFPRLSKVVQGLPNDARRRWMLGSLLPQMTERLFPLVLAFFQALPDQDQRAQGLRSLVSRVPERFFSQVWDAVQALPEEEMRVSVLEALAPRVPEQHFAQVWEAAQALSSPGLRLRVVEALAGHVPAPFFAQVWAALREAQSILNQERMLDLLAPHVPEAFFPAFLDEVQGMHNETLQVHTLVALAPVVPERFFSQYWSAVRAINNRRQQAVTLKTLLPYMPGERMAEVRLIVQTMPPGEEQLELLKVLLPRLSQEQCVDMLAMLVPPQGGLAEGLAAAEASWNTRWYLRALTLLVPYLPADQSREFLPALLREVRAIGSEEDRVSLLIGLASVIPGTLLEEMLESIHSLHIALYRVQLLTALLTPFSQEKWASVLEQVNARVRDGGDLHLLLDLVQAGAVCAEQPSSPILYPALHTLLPGLAQHTRQDALPDLALLAPAIRIVGGEEAAIGVCSATLEVGLWWA